MASNPMPIGLISIIEKPTTDVSVTEYPNGISIFETGSPESVFPDVNATIVTVKKSTGRIFQVSLSINDASVMRFRVGHLSLGWQPWRTLTGIIS